MPYKQLKDANMNTPYIGGYCEGFVEMAWGQATMNSQHTETYGVYPTAIGNRLGLSAWDAQPIKHYDLPPVGKTVPVYFSLGSTPDGHVAISLDDGKVTSSTQAGYHASPYFHPNLNHLITLYGKYNGGCTYLGWGEYVGRIKVIEGDEMIDKATLDILFNTFLGRTPDPDAISHYVGKYTVAFVVADLNASSERKTYLVRQAKVASDLKASQAEAGILQQAVDTLTAKLNAPKPVGGTIVTDTALAKDTNAKITLIQTLLNKIFRS